MKYLSNCRKKFGKVFVFWRCHNPLIIISDDQLVRQILTDTKTFNKGTDYTEKFASALGEGLITSVGERHKQDRNTLSKYFARGSIEKRIEQINFLTNEMMARIFEPAVGTSIDLQGFFHLLSLQIFGIHAISRDYLKEQELARWLNDSVCHGSAVLGKYLSIGLPLFFWKFIPDLRSLSRNTKKLNRHWKDVVDERVRHLDSDEPDKIDDCLTAMLKSGLTKEQIYSHLTTLITAGHDTTAYFSCYVSYVIAQHQDVQLKLKEEIKAVMGDRIEVTAEDIQKMVYLRKVMQETLRLYAVAPNVSRVTTQDITLEPKITIPKGTTVLLPLFLINRDPDIWEDPGEFRPERFDDIDGFSCAKKGYFPFGYGSRTCIGNQLAIIESAVMITRILQKYSFAPNPAFKPKIISGITLVSNNGIEVVIKRDSDLTKF
jgi:cytochrome P450